MSKDKTLTRAAFAEAHGVTERTVARWLAAGDAVARGERILVAKSDELLEARGLGRFGRTTPSPPPPKKSKPRARKKKAAAPSQKKASPKKKQRRKSKAKPPKAEKSAPPADPETMSKAEFARSHHVAESSVTRWIRAGEVMTKDGRVLVAESNARLEGRKLGRFGRVDSSPEPSTNGNGKPPEEDSGDWTYSEAKRRKEIELALKHRIAREEKEGRLVDREEERREQYAVARQVREALLSWSGRVAAEMAVDLGIEASDLGAVLEGYVRRFLNDQADELLRSP